MTDKELAPHGAFCITQTTEEYLDTQIASMLDGDLLVRDDVPIYQKIDLISSLAVQAGLSIRETNALVTRILNNSKETFINSEEYNPEYRWTADMSVDGISHMIETKCTVEEALKYVQEKHSKDDLWLGKTRNKGLTRRTRIEAVNKIETVHKQEIGRLKKDAQYKRSKLTKIRTPSGQLNEVKDLITVADRVDYLYEVVHTQGDEIIELKSELNELRMRVKFSEQNIQTIGDSLNIKTISMKEEVMKLKDLYTIEQISEILNIKERKVKYLIYGK